MNQIAAAVVVLAAFLYVGVWQWMICRVYVAPGQMLVVSSHLGRANLDPENQLVVEDGYKGVQRRVLGEGRYFVNPLFNIRTKMPALTIANDEMGVVTSKTGEPLPDEQFLVLPEDDIYAKKGIWRDVLTPGTYRMNPAAFDVEIVKAYKVLPGYVGCVTALAGSEPGHGKLADEGQRGVRKKVLQPGIYYLNPKAARVDSVEIGYRELSLDDVSFHSKDGFPIKLDITVVWGLEPANVPSVLMHFGNVKQVEEKIVTPQIESICRMEGSRYGAKELIEGDTREAFQSNFTAQLTKVASEKKISVRLGLVRAIEVPIEIRQPIQQTRVAQEERITKQEQQLTQERTNELAELQSDVDKGVREVAADTERLIAELRATGEKQVASIQGQQMVEVAVVEKKIAELTGQRTLLLGEADAAVAQLTAEADADRLKQNVDAIGGAAAYANFQFASNLPETFKVFIRYAGPGTFWTDASGGSKALQEAATLKILEGRK